MKIALLQHNFVVGDLAHNAEKIRRGYQQAASFGADLVVSTELALCGYPPRDLLEQKAFVAKQVQELARLAKSIKTPPLIVGFAEQNQGIEGKPLFNAAAVLSGGKIDSVRRKALLPTYDVFDEYRYFEPHLPVQKPVSILGKRIGLLICEDIWNGIEDPKGRKQYQYDPVDALEKERLDALVVINGSPYFWGKGDARFRLVSGIARRIAAPVAYSNQVGGNDELIFDGRSFAVNREGICIGSAKAFEEDVLLVDTAAIQEAPFVSDTGNLAEVKTALVTGLRDYVEKVGHFLGGAVFGLSGGIDSALVAAIAKEALGNERVLAVAMPSPFSSKESEEDAYALSKNLGIGFLVVPIQEAFRAYQTMLQANIGWSEPPTITEENIQSRIRGMILMAIANKQKRIVLGTGNKSELAMGYATLYGDMAAGLGIISDLPKTLVYELARFINREQEIIPKRILEKPPSAELKPDQKDTDSLPPYEVLDPILHAYIEERQGLEEIVANGQDRALVERIIRTVDAMEFKRRQAAPGLKITTKAFGSGRRMPIAARFS